MKAQIKKEVQILPLRLWNNRSALQCIVVSITMIKDPNRIFLVILLTIFCYDLKTTRPCIPHVNCDRNAVKTGRYMLMWKRLCMRTSFFLETIHLEGFGQWRGLISQENSNHLAWSRFRHKKKNVHIIDDLWFLL